MGWGGGVKLEGEGVDIKTRPGGHTWFIHELWGTPVNLFIVYSIVRVR